MHDGWAFAGDVAGAEALSFEDAFQNFFHAEGQTVGLGEAFDLRLAIAGAEDGGELAVAVNALVVHLDDDDALEFGEDLFDAVRQRMEMTEMDGADFVFVVARELGLPEEIVNVEGGAVAHGHPIGATGAVLTTKLIHSMRRHGLTRGLVTLCIGGGQGIALAIEALH